MGSIQRLTAKLASSSSHYHPPPTTLPSTLIFLLLYWRLHLPSSTMASNAANYTVGPAQLHLSRLVSTSSMTVLNNCLLGRQANWHRQLNCSIFRLDYPIDVTPAFRRPREVVRGVSARDKTSSGSGEPLDQGAHSIWWNKFPEFSLIVSADFPHFFQIIYSSCQNFLEHFPILITCNIFSNLFLYVSETFSILLKKNTNVIPVKMAWNLFLSYLWPATTKPVGCHIIIIVCPCMAFSHYSLYLLEL